MYVTIIEGRKALVFTVMEELVARNHIMAKADVSDWKDAICKAGSLLVKSGEIEEEYIGNMIASVEQLGPYMVIAKGFALAHAAPCAAVKQNAVSLINLKRGVDFGSKNDPVEVVMCLACTDHESHIERLQKIAMRLMKAGTIEALIASENEEELYETINSGKENE